MGSTFDVSLPLVDVQRTSSQPSDWRALEPVGEGGATRHVVYVDDDDDEAMLLRSIGS